MATSTPAPSLTRFCFQIHQQLVAGWAATRANSRSTVSSSSVIGQHPVLEAVVVEDVGEARRDDRAEPVVGQGPDRVFAARAGAEVAACHEDGCAAHGGPIQFEIRIVPAVFEEPPVEEQELAEAGPFDPFEELLRNDLVGVDVRSVERGDQAAVRAKRVPW